MEEAAAVASGNSELDLYEVLQVHPGAEADVVSLVYRHIAKKYHPDLAPSHLKTDYAERMKLVNHAYSTISDPATRTEYDSCRPVDTNGANSFLLRFENAAVLAEAAAAGAGMAECYRRSARILESIAQDASGTKIECEALVRLAEVQFKGLQDYSAAALSFDRLAGLTPRGLDLDELLLLVVDCRCRSEQWSSALQACDRVTEQCTMPDTMAMARVHRGDVLDQLQRHAEAVEAFRLVVSTYPGTDGAGYAQYRCARILDSGMQRYREAVEAYKLVLRDYPSTEWAQDCQWRIDHIERKHIEKKAWWE